MKVLHIYKDYYPPVHGGIEKSINLLCRHLKSSLDVEVLITNNEFKTSVEIVEGIKVYKVADLGRVLSAPLSPLFPYWLGKIRADILHFHLPNPTAVVSYLLRRPKGKVVVTWHSDIIRQKNFLLFYRPFLYKFLKIADVIIGTSSKYIETSPHLSTFADKCVPIPLGIELSQYVETPEVKDRAFEIREEYGNRIVLFVGLLRYYKGLQYLIEAMKNIDGRLLIIGRGPMEKNLKKLTEDLKLKDKVFFLGVVDDKAKLYYLYSCDVFCLPSIFRSEGFGLSQLEAFACGKSVVSTNLNTGVPYVNQDNVTGFVVEPKCPDSLAEAITEILDKPELRKQFEEAAKLRVQEEFSVERVVERTKEIYRRLMEGVDG